MLKGIFWDNDGVLVDTEHLYYRAMRDTLAQAGIALPLERYARITLDRGISSLCLAEQAGLPPRDIARLRDAKNARYSRLLADGVEPLPGVRAALATLRRHRLRMGIVTSCRRDHFDLIHRRSGLPEQFDFVLTREDFHHIKPHPEPYLKALSRSGLPAAECIVIEDTRRGLEAALAAGLRCLIIPSRLTPQASYPGAWRVADDLAAAVSLLEGELQPGG